MFGEKSNLEYSRARKKWEEKLVISALPSKAVKKILSFYCLDTENVEKNLPEFLVAVSGEKIVGCACLDAGDIIELRSIAIMPAHRNKGIGSHLADAILERAAGMTDKVYLRTTSPIFFEKKGAHRLENEEKKIIWQECNKCDKFSICKQVLMRFDLQNKN